MSSRAVGAMVSAVCVAALLIFGLAGRYLVAVGEWSDLRLALFLAAGVGISWSTVALVRRFSALGRLLVYGLYLLGATEAGLQALAAAGSLPGVNINSGAPYGRTYWTQEGFSNSIQNRFGWHAPEWKLSRARPIVLIGDSFIEGVQVGPEENIGVRLAELIRGAGAREGGPAVLSLGVSGGGPAHHLELLAYAARHFAPREAIVFVTMVNDYRNALERMQHTAPDRYPYYRLDPSGRLVLTPGSDRGRDLFARKLDFRHRSLLANLPRTLFSHSMLLAVARTVAEEAAQPQRRVVPANGQDEPWADRFPFVEGGDADEAFDVLDALLRACRDLGRRQGIELRIVTIPFLPPDFDRESGETWSLQFGDEDFLRPERDLEAFGSREGIQVLPMGRWLREHGVTAEQVRGMYFRVGRTRGHWTRLGHEMFARAVFESFYREGEDAPSAPPTQARIDPPGPAVGRP